MSDRAAGSAIPAQGTAGIRWRKAAHVLSWGLGVFAPLALLVVDPGVFRAGMHGTGLFFEFRAFCVVVITLSAACLACRLLTSRPTAFLGGALAAGATFAAPIGILLLPLGFLALMRGEWFAALGVVPAGVALLFAWHAQAVLLSVDKGRQSEAFFRGLAGFFGTFSIALLFQVVAGRVLDSSVEDIVSGDPQRYELGVRRMESWSLFLDSGSLIAEWRHEPTAEGKQSLSSAYSRLSDSSFELLLD